MSETIRMTSAEAAKLLRKLNEQLDNVLLMEQQSREFSAALGEDVDSVRPAYDYGKIQEQIESLETRIRQVKHALNSFNLVQEVPGFAGMTIDQMLVYIPQLSRRKSKLSLMQQRLPRQRERVSYGQPFPAACNRIPPPHGGMSERTPATGFHRHHYIICVSQP